MATSAVLDRPVLVNRCLEILDSALEKHAIGIPPGIAKVQGRNRIASMTDDELLDLLTMHGMANPFGHTPEGKRDGFEIVRVA